MIAIDFIVASLPDKIHKIIAIVLQILGLTVILVFAYEATIWILRPEVRLELSPSTQLPAWINYTLFPIAFYGMAIHMIVGFLTTITSFKEES